MRSDQPLVSFQARILQQEYGAWPNAFRGVRVYYEGFRVLPYGDPRDDWLDLDRDYRSRGRTELARLRRFAEWDFPPGDERESLSVQGNGAFFGGVFFTRNGARELQMLVNREGFLPNPAFDGVADLVRLGIDLQVRLRYATTSEIKQARKSDSERQKQAASQGGRQDAPSGFLVASLQQDALTTIREARTALAAGRGGDAAQKLDLIEERLTSANAIVKEAVSEVTMYRILASIGLEHAAFVHEVNSLALTAQSIAAVLEGLAHEAQGTLKQRLRQLVAEIHDLRERLRRNAVYLADMTGVEGRRRRSRQRLRSAIEKITAFFARSIAERGLTILNEVPEKAETPPMFPAEVYAIVSNLLSNAVKFSGRGGRIRASVRDEPGALVFRLENTGARINLRGAERWFEPFRSTTTEIDESLGQGMGLGLTITRSLVDEYGGIIQFVSPSKGYNTAVEVTLPRR
jgi:signal transduction histidine kinase